MPLPSDVVYRGFEWMKVESMPAAHFEFPKPMTGWWNGTLTGGRFGIDVIGHTCRIGKYVEHPGPGVWIRWGCFSANHWFTCKSGRSWKDAALIASKYVQRNTPIGTVTKIVFEDARFDMDAYEKEHSNVGE